MNGILTFAHNTQYDYLKLAKSLARRSAEFLDLPVTVITDIETLKSTNHSTDEFDSVIVVDKPDDNSKQRRIWLNKGRWSAFDLSPYEDTLIIDSDYIINSKSVLSFFNSSTDFTCFRRAKYLFEDRNNEKLSSLSFDTYWATGIRFKKTIRTEQIFKMMHDIQKNYEYYSNLYGFMQYTFRNDYALTIALRTVNGQIERKEDFVHYDLINIEKQVNITKINKTTYNFYKDVLVNDFAKKFYIQTTNFDFHVLDKKICLELADE